MWDFNDPARFKQQVVEAFNRTPTGYGTNGDFHWQHARRLVELADLQPGEAVLDVATGTAPAAIVAAGLVGSTGRVIGLDISPAMLDQARFNVEKAGLPNLITLLEGDAENLPFGPAQFEAVLCASSLPWFPNIPKALSEFNRVLKSVGRLTFSCWGGPAQATRITLLNEALAPFGQHLAELNDRLNSPQKCRTLLLEAGFENIEVLTEDEKPGPTDAAGDFQLNWPGISVRFGISLSDDALEKVRAAYIARFEETSRHEPDWNYTYTQFVIADFKS